MPPVLLQSARAFAAVLLMALLLAGARPAQAQTLTNPAPTAEAPAPAVPAQAVPAEQLQALVGTLQDDAARARLVEQLQALIAAREAIEPPAAPLTLGARMLAFLSDRVEALSAGLVQVATVFSDLPGIAEWLRGQVEDPIARDRWVELVGQLTLILAAGFAARWAALGLLRRPRAAIEERRPATALGRLPFLLLRALVDLVPIAAFALVGYGLLSVTEPGLRVRLAALTVINASVGVQMVMLGARFLFSHTAPNLRLIRMADETAAYAYVWVRRLAFASIYGYFLTEGAYVLGLPLAAYTAVLKLLGLLVAGMLVILILQNRAAVAQWLHGAPLSGNGDSAEVAAREAEGRGAVMRSARGRFAEIWHIFAILYVVVTFGVWVLDVYGGFAYLAQATAVTAIVLVVARFLVNGMDRALRRGFRVSPDLKAAFPDLEERANRYLPILHHTLKAAIWAVAALAVLNAWGVNTLDWLETPAGQRVLGSLLTIAIVLVLAAAAWELVSALIERYLTGEPDANGAVVERSARVRTLLPLLRNAFLVLLVVVVSLITLSELGVNIAPLLAGAGVVGLAIGFGSQTLVKDVITGLFILFEDTISVGDVVDVGGGHSGVVEAISIRTIRLRDLSGSVHSVPFSAVTVVKNLTKDFSFYVFHVQVGYSEDPDRVVEVLNALGAEMRADPAYARDILAPLEILGLDRLADSGIVIMARFKTRPIRQWAVGREFNRRMKKRFDELGINIPYPHMQIIMPDRPRGATPLPSSPSAAPRVETGEG